MKTRMTIAVLLLLAVAARAEETGVEKAERLREESGTAWNEERYADAAALLREADELYRAAEGDFVEQRAITLRALTWNQVRMGETDAARDTWARLSELTRDVKGLTSEVWSAYTGLYEAAEKSGEPGKFFAPVRKAALAHGRPEIAAQVLHDTGYLLFHSGHTKEAEKAYEAAIRERRKIGDEAGLGWSRTNLANLLLASDRLEEALPLLSAAFLSARREKDPVGPHQAALAVNLRDALDRIAKLEKPGKKVVDWLWWMADTASVDTPEIVPAHVFFRAALAADPSPKAAERVASVRLPGRPPEVRADLVIRAAMAIAGGKNARRARAWIERLEIGDGPAAPHLAARRALARTFVSSSLGEKERFRTEAATAADAWRDLGDFAGRRNALQALAAMIQALGLEDSLADLVAEANEVRQAGSPGGAGGSASASGDRSGYGNLGILDPLFTIEMGSDGRIVLSDLIAEKTQAAAVSWTPKPIGLNGLSLMVFGGYVRIQDLSYGGAASASGAPGSLTLDEMDEYFPVPARGKLVILKNGAVTYRE